MRTWGVGHEVEASPLDPSPITGRLPTPITRKLYPQEKGDLHASHICNDYGSF
jgi:hypothetical protein